MRELKEELKKTSAGRKFLEEAEPCEMTTEEYRQRMMQAFQNANCDELISVCVLPTEKEFEHLEWLLKNHYRKEPCEDAISREDVIKAVDHHTFETDDGLCLDEDITIILEELSPVTPTQRWIPVGEKYEHHIDHTDCIWYGNDSGCPATCSQYRDGWNDAMDYIFKNGDGYRPYRRK